MPSAGLHSGLDWSLIAPHLPNPDTASAASLETAGDVLRARHFPEDALNYYGYAMTRGGDVSELLNKMGVVRLELRQNALAHEIFQRTVRLHKKDAVAWNNLGVTEYIMKNYGSAIADYKRAAKLDKESQSAAVYHSNLGMAYFENKNMDSARAEFTFAVRLNPKIMDERDEGGSAARIVGSENYSELCFEMARLYAGEHNEAEMRKWLAKANENGFNVRDAMRNDTVLQAYRKDPEVLLMLSNPAEYKARQASGTGEAPQNIN